MEKIVQLQDLQPGSAYLVRARAVNKYGVVSEWSQTFTLNVISDDLAPSQPSAPTIEIAGPQKIVVSHNNTKNAGGDLEFDVVSYKVFENTVDNNTTGTLIHTMSATRPGSGIDSFATINVDVKDTDPSATRYYYVTAVDASGNESDSSPTATGVSITFFESAYISNLTADKIQTGTLQANQQISVGTVSPIVIKSNATSPRGQIYNGAGNYNNIDTAFYLDSTGKFSLHDKLVWDGSALSITDGTLIAPNIESVTIRSGNLISTNYESNNGSTTEQSTTFTNAGTWIDLDDGTIYSKNFYIDPQGSAVFRGNIFGSRAKFNGELPVSEIPNLENPSGSRIPTVMVESTDTDDGYLVFFKDAGTDSGLEFYTKQGNGTNWRRGSLAHLDDVPGGFLRLGAFPSSTDITPGRMRIFAQDTNDGKKGEIYLDASRTYAQRLFLTQPSTTGDWTTDPVTNFWKDPDYVSNGQDYFKVGSTSGSAITVKKDSNGLDKVTIKDYEIIGVAKIIDQSSISIIDVSGSIDLIKIGKNVDGTRDGISINSDNYWTLNNDGSNVRFRVGSTSSNYLNWDGSTLTVNGNINITGGNAATTTYADGAAASAVAALSITSKWNGQITGVTLDSTGKIYSSGKTYNSTTAGWILEYNAGTPRFEIGSTSSKYMQWTGSNLIINGELVGGTEIGNGTGVIVEDDGTYNGINVNNVLRITGYSGVGTIAFSNSSGVEKGSLFDAALNKNTVTYGSGRGVALGSSGAYPFVEVGWETDTGTGAPRIVLKTANTTFSDPYLGNLSGPGIVINGSNFSIVGGNSSFIYAPEGTSPVKFLAKNSSGYLRWADPPSGSGTSGVDSFNGRTGAVSLLDSDIQGLGNISSLGLLTGSGFRNSSASTTVEAWYGTTASAGSLPSAANYPANTILVVI